MTTNTKRVIEALGKWIENGQKRPRKYVRSPRCTTRPRHDGPELIEATKKLKEN